VRKGDKTLTRWAKTAGVLGQSVWRDDSEGGESPKERGAEEDLGSRVNESRGGNPSLGGKYYPEARR